MFELILSLAIFCTLLISFLTIYLYKKIKIIVLSTRYEIDELSRIVERIDAHTHVCENYLCGLCNDLYQLKKNIETLGENKNLNDISTKDREERWDRIRKAFEKKEKEQDGSR